MEMLLMGACLSVFGLAVAALAFGAATRDAREAPGARPQPVAAKAASRPRFFVEPSTLPAGVQARVPIEALLLQIESHVRLEQAAAETFLESPTPALLHSRTISPLAN